MSPKHIVFYIGSLARGGAERVFANLAEWLFEKGHSVTFVTTYLAENEYEVVNCSWREVSKEELPELNGRYQEVMRPDETPAYVTYLSVPASGKPYIYRHFSGLQAKDQTSSRPINLAKRTKLLRDVFERIHPDVIVSAIGKNNVMALVSTIGMNIPVVVTCVANLNMEYPTRNQYISMTTTFRRAAGIVFQLKAQQALYPPQIASRGTILRNSIDTQFLVPRYEGERQKTIVACGRMDRNKNHAMLIKAFARLASTHPEWNLIVYGDGPEMKHLRSLVIALGLRGRVELPGYVNNIEERIYKAGCYVLCSNEEGMPNSLLEAMSLGLPCVSTDCPCGGPAELIQDGVNGLLTPVGDVTRLEKTMLRILDNPGMSRTMGINATKIQEEFASTKVNPEWEMYLLGIIASHEEDMSMTGQS